MNLNLNHIVFAATLAGALCTGSDAAAQAFNQSISRSYSRTVGNSYLGVTGYAWGYMRGYNIDPSITPSSGTTTASVYGRGYLRATGKILKQTAELARFDCIGSASTTTSSASTSGSYRLLLAGKTVVSRSFSSTVTFPKFEKYVSLFPTDPRADVPVGPFTLTLKGNAGAGVEAYGFAFLSASPALNIYGVAQGWGQGRANVEFGIFGFGVGAEVSARLAQQTFSASLRPSKTALRGSVDWAMVAVSLKLRAYAYALWGWAKYSTTLLSASYGSVYRTLFSL